MALFLNEDDVNSLLSVTDAIGVLEGPIREQGQKLAFNKPRSIVKSGTSSVSVLQAVVPSLGRMGFKTYTVGPEGARFWLMLFADSGELLSLIEADNVGRIRTGGATGIATKYMSRADSKVGAILGSGVQAGSQLEAMCAVRRFDKVLAWSRTRSNLEAFCKKMSAQLGIAVEPADSVEQAVRAADVVTTITSAKDPILRGEWLREGAHVNLVGAMKITHCEADGQVLARAGLLAVDDLVQSRAEAREFNEAVDAGLIRWENVVELSDVVAAQTPMRKSPAEISVFKSHGIGLWDIAAADAIYKNAIARSVGVRLPIEQAVVRLGGPDSDRTKM